MATKKKVPEKKVPEKKVVEDYVPEVYILIDYEDEEHLYFFEFKDLMDHVMDDWDNGLETFEEEWKKGKIEVLRVIGGEVTVLKDFCIPKTQYNYMFR